MANSWALLKILERIGEIGRDVWNFQNVLSECFALGTSVRNVSYGSGNEINVS